MKVERTTTPNDEGRREVASQPHGIQPVPRSTRFTSPASLAEQMPGVRHIELNLHDVEQLFNTMDPSPFHEKDLDDDAAEFILSWAEEFHRPEPVDLIVHLEKMPDGHNAQRLVEEAVHNYFAYRARLNKLEFKRLMKQGRLSLLVGLSFLFACFLVY